MRHLITGGAGFVGSHLADKLAGRGDEVTILDDLSTGRIENVDALLDAGRARLVVESADDLLPVGAVVAAGWMLANKHLVSRLLIQGDHWRVHTVGPGLITLGVLIGVLPGLGGANGVAILLPLTFTMSPTSAIVCPSTSGRVHRSSPTTWLTRSCTVQSPQGVGPDQSAGPRPTVATQPSTLRR